LESAVPILESTKVGGRILLQNFFFSGLSAQFRRLKGEFTISKKYASEEPKSKNLLPPYLTTCSRNSYA
jgi:hypothetical protein